MVRGLSYFLLIVLGTVVDVAAERPSLFGRRSTGESTESPEVSPDSGSKAEPEAKPKHPGSETKPTGGLTDKSGRAAPTVDSNPAPSDDTKPVRIRPVDLVQRDRDLPLSETLEFRLSRIDKPLSHETSALFRQAWEAFRAQHRWHQSRFERLPGLQLSMGVMPLQDLGEGRWLVDAEWTNPGHFTWCRPGPHASQAIVMVANSAIRLEPQRALPVTLVGLVDLRFNCEIEPAAGQRLTLRRFAFLETSPLPDDEATRTAFSEAVQSGANLSAVVALERSCKTCNGLGFIRREIPGKIQHARDPCPSNCRSGKRWLAVEIAFRP